jgi:hypothetical protein
MSKPLALAQRDAFQVPDAVSGQEPDSVSAQEPDSVSNQEPDSISGHEPDTVAVALRLTRKLPE